MGKKSLHQEQVMTDVYVDEVADWARRLTHTESRGPGDTENAWHRLEARYGVPWRTFWALRYRRPKDIAVSVYFQMLAAYEDQCARQARRLQHEITITKAKAGASHPVVLAAQAVVDAAEIKPKSPSGVA